MKKYILTSDKWTGQIELIYGINGYLTGLNIEASFVSDEQHQRLLFAIPLVNRGEEWDKLAKSPRLIEVKEEITFQMFWEKYDYKEGKMVAERRWNNLSKANQQKAYHYIAIYNQRRMAKTPPPSKKYPETYLNQQIWNN